jgi:hypothetical protein
MMRAKTRGWAAAVAIVTGALLAGCVNLGAVRSYADETKKLTSAFTPMLDGSVQSCRDRKSRIRLYTGTQPFDPVQISKDVDKLCNSIAESNGHALEIARTLSDYAEVLAKLAGEAVPNVLDSSEDRLKVALGRLRDSDGKALVPEAKLSAVFNLAKFVSHAATGYFRDREVRAALNHHEAVETLGNALALYVRSNFMGYVADERRDLDIIFKAIGAREKSEYLAARYIQRELWVVRSQLDAKEKSAKQFEAATARMIAAHKDLLENADRLDDPARYKEIFAFARDVRALQEQLRDAF